MPVVGIGQCSWDYLAVVDSLPARDTKREVLRWEEQGGGPVATALVTLSRLGIGCRFHGVVGDDGAGQKIRQSLVKEDIDVAGLLQRDGAQSQKAFIAIEKESGTRTIFWKRPSGQELTRDELGSHFLDNGYFLLLDGLMKDVSLYAAERANDLNIPVMLDAGRLREGMTDIASRCDYVVGSEEFAKELGWNDNPEHFRQTMRELRPLVTTITLGERGSVTFAQDTIIEVPAFKIHAADTTGAGDVFHGGYIYGLLQGWDTRECVRFASAVAALKCRKVGGRAGIPSLSEVMKFLEEQRI
ncbi:MAG TPA: PfkB family carbohydrate kinase [Thermodesulfovibrionales bacterium]|nr:PfkB family carbohydrate kinase [Thermodesulfovibrionales bacterium]